MHTHVKRLVTAPMQRRQLVISHLIWKVLCCDFIGILCWDLHSITTLIVVCFAVSAHHFC